MIANTIARVLGVAPYRDEKPLRFAFEKAFYDSEKRMFRDSEGSGHINLVGNSFAYGFDLCPNEECKSNIVKLIDKHGMDSLSFFLHLPDTHEICQGRRIPSDEGCTIQ